VQCCDQMAVQPAQLRRRCVSYLAALDCFMLHPLGVVGAAFITLAA
jgi:hypothetical protein